MPLIYRSLGDLITAAIWNSDLVDSVNALQGGNIAGPLNVTAISGHAIGVAQNPRYGLIIGGGFAPSGAGGHDVGVLMAHAINAQVGAHASTLLVQGSMQEAGSGTHGVLSSLRVMAPTILNGGATTTTAAALYIDGTPTGGGANYALLVAAGNVAFAGDTYLAIGYREHGRSVNAGEYVDITPNSANFTSSAGTWTVDVGDVMTFKYALHGHRCKVVFVLNATATAGAGAELLIDVPGFLVATHGEVGYGRCFGGVQEHFTVIIDVAQSKLSLQRVPDGTTWGTHAGDLYIRGEIDFEFQP